MLNLFKAKHQKGDTIVEVLIVLAILSLAFSISYSTASQSLNKSRNSQEHSQGTTVSSSQLELLRAAYGKDVAIPTDRPFCMKSDGTVSSFAAASVIPSNPALDTFQTSLYPADCVIDNLYRVSIVAVGADPNLYFDVRVRWDGLNSLGKQQVETSYKVYKIEQAATSGTLLQASPPSVNVIVKKIPPLSVSGDVDKTPPCGNSATQNKSGSSVTLNGPSGFTATATTDASSTASFTNIPELAAGQYTATINSVPANYEICSLNPSGPVPAQGSQTINMKIRPRCSRYSYTTTTSSTTWNWTQRERTEAYDNWYIALNYSGGRTHFVAGPGVYGHPETNSNYYWYEFSGTVSPSDPGNTGYYWLYRATYDPTTTTTTTTNYNYNCPS